MSWAELDWCANLGPEVKAPLRSLLWAMAYHANRDSGHVTAGVRRLGPEAGVSPKTAQRLQHEAVRRGLLVLVKPGAGKRPATYRLACHLGDTLARPQRARSVSSEARSVSAKVTRNPNPNGETPQRRLARLAAQGDEGPGGRPPAPRPPRIRAVPILDDPALDAGWPPQLAASAW